MKTILVQMPVGQVDRARFETRLEILGIKTVATDAGLAIDAPSAEVEKWAKFSGPKCTLDANDILKNPAVDTAVRLRTKPFPDTAITTLCAAVELLAKSTRVDTDEKGDLADLRAATVSVAKLVEPLLKSGWATATASQAQRLEAVLRKLFDTVKPYEQKGKTVTARQLTEKQAPQMRLYANALDVLLQDLPEAMGEAAVPHKLKVRDNCMVRGTREVLCDASVEHR